MRSAYGDDASRRQNHLDTATNPRHVYRRPDLSLTIAAPRSAPFARSARTPAITVSRFAAGVPAGTATQRWYDDLRTDTVA
jgi:hypothetical protein